jgi:hypothetical protein
MARRRATEDSSQVDKVIGKRALARDQIQLPGYSTNRSVAMAVKMSTINSNVF